MQPQDHYDRILQVIKPFAEEFVNVDGNIPHPGRRPKCSDLNLMALCLLQESLDLASERRFFDFLEQHLPYLARSIGTRENFNARKRRLAPYMEKIRRLIVHKLNKQYDSNVYIIDSMPLQICRNARAKRCKILRSSSPNADPSFGYCASQQQFYFGFRFHCVCSAMGVIEHYDLSPAHIHDINFLHDIKDIFSNCVLVGDKGYRCTPWRLTLFEYAGIELSVPSKSNERLQYSMPDDYARIRKRIEVLFSQLVDQMNIRKNYAKSQVGFFSRIISKVTLLTLLQFVNASNHHSLNHIRYTLAA